MNSSAEPRKFFKKTDLLILSLIIAAAAAGWFLYSALSGREGLQAEIYVDSVLVETVDLTNPEPRSFSPDSGHVILHVGEQGTIRFEKSDCPDKICVNTGILRSAGHSAVCLPNKVMVKIVSKSGKPGDGPDLIQ